MKKNVTVIDPKGAITGPDFMADIEPHEMDDDIEGERNNLWAEDEIQAVEIPMEGTSVVAIYEDGTVRITNYSE